MEYYLNFRIQSMFVILTDAFDSKFWSHGPKVPDVSWELLGFGSNRQDTYVFWGLLKWRPQSWGGKR